MLMLRREEAGSLCTSTGVTTRQWRRAPCARRLDLAYPRRRGLPTVLRRVDRTHILFYYFIAGPGVNDRTSRFLPVWSA